MNHLASEHFAPRHLRALRLVVATPQPEPVVPQILNGGGGGGGGLGRMALVSDWPRDDELDLQIEQEDKDILDFIRVFLAWRDTA